MTHKEALDEAITALRQAKTNTTHGQIAWNCKEAIKKLEAIKEALAQPEQEPVAQWQKRHPDETDGLWQDTDAADATWWAAQKTNHGWEVREVYTTPPQRKPLTDYQIAEFAERMEASDPTDSFWREFARAIEAAHGIK